jgi:hypothetical protein
MGRAGRLLINSDVLIYTGTMSHDSALTSPDLAIALAQALTGLGHLRVTHAIYRGLPSNVHAVLLSAQDTSVNYMHKIMSINPTLRRFMEFTQDGWAEDIFTAVARRYFRKKSKILEEQMQTILEEHIIKPKTLLLIATHMILGHQLAAMKEEFAKKNNVHVVLIVVVTDDSPQHLWAVGGADMIFVPSEYCKRQLETYHKKQTDMPGTTYIVAPYMVSPILGTELSDVQFRRRTQELDPARLASIHMSIPISGAAVQLAYFSKLITELEQESDRYVFQIVSQQSASTRDFLSQMIGKHNVRLHVSASHREVVELYEDIFDKEVIALEVTKPSEQAFKALFKPRQRGGCILLFSDPVGRQEWDNVRFLQRHSLLPNAGDQIALWRAPMLHKKLDDTLRIRARSWRALRLPTHSYASARFIHWALEERLFATMMRFSGFQENPELSSKGVDIFWNRVNQYIEQKETTG